MATTDTVTLLFTDIEDSTRMWEQRAAEMRPALELHDRIVREAIESSGGRVVKTTGDGMLAVFGNATDALSASLVAQRALQAIVPGAPDDRASPLALKVRMGLHTGVAELRDGDYFGTSVNRAARVMAAAYGDQILLSAATAKLVRDSLPDSVALRELGEHRLKGLLDPEQLVQVVAAGLRADFPPLAAQTAHSLPAERDAFVGRNDALADLDRRFAAGARLVSVAGPGGSGKTRLATRFGWKALANFAGGVWFCDVAQAREEDGLAQAVAQGLGVPLGKDDPVAQLGQAIAGRSRCLVILDNFEQVTRCAEPTLGSWLSRAHNARFLVTTREVLGLAGEEVLSLAPLAPSDAAELFVRRAQAAKPGFAPGAEDSAAIAALVKMLDGLPLAIELAAARVRVMPPRTLLARMTERFKLLSSMGGRIDRQATLRAVFDWSWDLLSPPEKAALAQLSVFEGGFTLDAVEAVLDLSLLDNAPWAVDVLQSLVQKSLVRIVSDDRFDLLVSIQEYAAEHLRSEARFEGSGDAARRAAEARHGGYFAALDAEAATANGCVELDNIIAACRRAAARGDLDTAARALENAWAGLEQRGPFRTAVDLCATVTSAGKADADAATAARIGVVAGGALQYCGRVSDARVRLQAALSRAREVGDHRRECQALTHLGTVEAHEGNTESMRSDLRTALDIANELNDRGLQSKALNGLGQLESIVGRPDDARANYEGAVILARQGRDRRLEGAILANLAILHGSIGPPDKARAYAEAALDVAKQMGDRRVEGNSLCQLGLLQLLEGQLAEAEHSFESALVMAREMGNTNLEIVALCNLGIAHERWSRVDDARRVLEQALVIAREHGHKRAEGQVLGYLGLVHARRGDFAAARTCLDAGESLLRAASDPESLGILLALRAEAEQLAGSAGDARSALAAAEEIAAAVSPAANSEFGNALTRARGSLAD